MGPGWHGSAGTGSPSSSAPTVVSIVVCTNWPATAMIGPLPHGSVTARCAVARGVGGGDGPALRIQRGHLGQTRRFELVETQCRAVDDLVPVEDGHLHRVGDLRSKLQRLRTGVGGQPPHLWAVAEVDRDKARMCGQRR